MHFPLPLTCLNDQLIFQKDFPKPFIYKKVIVLDLTRILIFLYVSFPVSLYFIENIGARTILCLHFHLIY